MRALRSAMVSTTCKLARPCCTTPASTNARSSTPCTAPPASITACDTIPMSPMELPPYTRACPCAAIHAPRSRAVRSNASFPFDVDPQYTVMFKSASLRPAWTLVARSDQTTSVQNANRETPEPIIAGRSEQNRKRALRDHTHRAQAACQRERFLYTNPKNMHRAGSSVEVSTTRTTVGIQPTLTISDIL